jgi:hypothetical protein
VIVGVGGLRSRGDCSMGVRTNGGERGLSARDTLSVSADFWFICCISWYTSPGCTGRFVIDFGKSSETVLSRTIYVSFELPENTGNGAINGIR